MALINCPECGKEMSDSLKKCPHCGYKIKQSQNILIILIAVIVIITLGVIGGISFYNNSIKLSSSENKKVEEYNKKINELIKENYDELSLDDLKNESESCESLNGELNSLKSKLKKHIQIDEFEKYKSNIDAKITSIEEQKVNEVKDEIDKIGEVSIDSEQSIKDAEKKYEELEDYLKEKVDNSNVIEEAKSKYDELVVSDMESRINNLGKAEYSNTYLKKLEKVEKMYSSLDSELKNKVSNYTDVINGRNEYDKLKKEAEEKEKKRREKEKIEEIKKSITVNSLSFEMNSIGGCDVSISGYNVSNKTINYINFYISAYNAVGDKIACDIRGFNLPGLEYTGPLQPLGRFNGTWETVCYNYSLKKFKIDSIEIEFSDETELEISEEYIKYVKKY